MKQATEDNTSEGDHLTCYGFDCVSVGAVVTVKRNEHGLYFLCNKGKHYLDGQLNEHNEYVGLFHI